MGKVTLMDIEGDCNPLENKGMDPTQMQSYDKTWDLTIVRLKSQVHSWLFLEPFHF